jgi:uroporphyrinogen-III synthase
MSPTIAQIFKAIKFTRELTQRDFEEILKTASIMANDGTGKKILIVSSKEEVDLLEKHLDKSLVKVI